MASGMDRLIEAIEMIRQKLPGWRRHCLNETSTRTIIIDELLRALGWDVSDPDEVQLEYPTVDSKFVDYALKLNRKPVLLVEAKALGDGLEDVKAITQITGYAANDGIVWCILTNGVKWRVYRSVEQCPAPDKMMYEADLDPDSPDGMTVEQVARQMWRFSCEEMAKGTLDALGEQTFTDGKVRKALQALLADPPRSLLNLVRSASGDGDIAPRQIKESLVRIASDAEAGDAPLGPDTPKARAPAKANDGSRSDGARKAWATRRAKKGQSPYDEAHHLRGRPQEAVSLYRSLERLCLSFLPSGVSRRYLAKSVNFILGKRCFCSVHVLQGGLRVWLPMKFGHIGNPPAFARDVSNIGHWGAGDVELRITNRDELEKATELIQRSFESVG